MVGVVVLLLVEILGPHTPQTPNVFDQFNRKSEFVLHPDKEAFADLDRAAVIEPPKRHAIAAEVTEKTTAFVASGLARAANRRLRFRRPYASQDETSG